MEFIKTFFGFILIAFLALTIVFWFGKMAGFFNRYEKKSKTSKILFFGFAIGFVGWFLFQIICIETTPVQIP